MTDGTVSQDVIEIERVFDAPVETVWDMWTKPEHFKAWYGPDGFEIPVVELNVNVGGKRRFNMVSDMPDGAMSLWFIGEYLEIAPYTRLVFTENMTDEAGNVISLADMGMGDDDTPIVTTVTVLLEALPGQTKMTMTHAGVAPELGAIDGWNQSLDKMAAYVAK